MQTSKAQLYRGTWGPPRLGKHLKNLAPIFLLFKEKWDNWTQLCLDRANNVPYFIWIVHTLTETKESSIQATTTTPPPR
jgi:hypothetical protein